MARLKHEGWVYIDGTPKWHYVSEDGRALCGRWLYLGSVEPETGNDGSKDNCAACRKKLEKFNEKLKASAPPAPRGGES